MPYEKINFWTRRFQSAEVQMAPIVRIESLRLALGGKLKLDRNFCSSAVVCDPSIFELEERGGVMGQLVDCLYAPPNAKNLRDLNLILATMGLGKSRIIDETVKCMQKRLQAGACGAALPVAISLNTRMFGSFSNPNPTARTTIVSRMLMSYFAAEPSPSVLLRIESISGDITLEEATAIILQDYNQSRDVSQTDRVCLFIDELAKSGESYAQELINIVCSELDSNPNFSFVGTMLEWSPITDKLITLSGRRVRFFPVEVLSESASKRLITEATRSAYHDSDIAFAAAALGGHPRLLQVFRTAYLSGTPGGTPTIEELLELTTTSVDATYFLASSEIKLALQHSLMRRKAVILNEGLRSAIASGKILATFSEPFDNFVSLSVPALIMRRSIASADAGEHLSVEDIDRLQEVATVSGGRSLQKCGEVNRKKSATGKLFEQYHSSAEAAQWGLRLGTSSTLNGFYKGAVHRSGVALSDAFEYSQPARRAVTLPALRASFPAKLFDGQLCKAFDVKTVSEAVDKMCRTRSMVVPTYQYQQGYDYLYGVRRHDGRNMVVTVEPSFGLSGYIAHEEDLRKRMVEKFQACKKLDWVRLGLTYSTDVVHVLVFHAQLPGDWNWEHEIKMLGAHNVVVLDRQSCRRFYAGLSALSPFPFEKPPST